MTITVSLATSGTVVVGTANDVEFPSHLFELGTEVARVARQAWS